MIDTNIFIAIKGYSVLTSIITSLFTKISKDESDKLQYITNERRQWRDDIRKAIVEVRKISDDKQTDKMFKTIQEDRTYFQVRLNPEDAEENKLPDCFGFSIISNNRVAWFKRATSKYKHIEYATISKRNSTLPYVIAFNTLSSSSFCNKWSLDDFLKKQ